MDIEKLKDQYRNPVVPKKQPIATIGAGPEVSDSELIVRANQLKGLVLDWAKETLQQDILDLEIKEVKDIAAIIKGVTDSIQLPKDQAPSQQVNVLVQNFIDGRKDDC